MPDSDLLQWLQSRGFYALLILVLLLVGLLLALARRRKDRTRPGTRRLSLQGKPRRGRRR
jgi:O-antigen ligase